MHFFMKKKIAEIRAIVAGDQWAILSLESRSLESVVSQDMVSSITSAISSAVLESLKSAGISEPVQTSDPAALYLLPPLLASPQADHRPDKIHTLISVPLSSRVLDKIQSKIWANEYIDLGTLLSSFPCDPKYNFTVESSGSNQPVVSVEPVHFRFLLPSIPSDFRTVLLD